ncbi:MAG: DnaA ATPase domain-containing protein [Candidatus Thorarchaeota archaeon]
MKTINGISVGNYTWGTIKSALEQEKKVYVSTPDGGIGDCPNCGGGGVIIVTVTPRFAVNSPAGNVTSIDGHWYRSENKSDPCPICKATPDIQELFEDSGISYTESSWTLDYIEGMPGKENALTAARVILAMSPRPAGVYTFFGDYGTGKTGILKSMTAALVKSHIKCKYIRAADYLSELRATYNNNEDDEVTVSGKYIRYQFLAIDEVDRISNTDWARSTLFALLDKRYEDRGRLATVLSTNQFPDSMGEDWKYLMSRMLDGLRVPVGGRSLRGG